MPQVSSGLLEQQIESVLGPKPDGEPAPLRVLERAWDDLARQWDTMADRLESQALVVAGTAVTLTELGKRQNSTVTDMRNQGEFCRNNAAQCGRTATDFELGQWTWNAIGIIMVAQLTADAFLVFASGPIGVAKVTATRLGAQLAWRRALQQLVEVIATNGIGIAASRSRILLLSTFVGGALGAGVPLVAQARQVQRGHRDQIETTQVAIGGIAGALGGLFGAGAAVGAAPLVNRLTQVMAKSTHGRWRRFAATATGTVLIGAGSGAAGGVGGFLGGAGGSWALTGQANWRWEDFKTGVLTGMLGEVIGGASHTVHAATHSRPVVAGVPESGRVLNLLGAQTFPATTGPNTQLRHWTELEQLHNGRLIPVLGEPEGTGPLALVDRVAHELSSIPGQANSAVLVIDNGRGAHTITLSEVNGRVVVFDPHSPASRELGGTRTPVPVDYNTWARTQLYGNVEKAWALYQTYTPDHTLTALHPLTTDAPDQRHPDQMPEHPILGAADPEADIVPGETDGDAPLTFDTSAIVMPREDWTAVYDLVASGEHLIQTGSVRDDQFEAGLYSQTKYGSHRAANQYGHALGEALVQQWPDWAYSENATVVANPYFRTPHAAHLITNAAEQVINRHRAERDLPPITRVEIRRDSTHVGANEKSYGTMNSSERVLWSGVNPIVFRDGDVGLAGVRGRDVVAIDDVLVTGTSGQQMLDFLRQEGEAGRARVAYVAALDKKDADASIEAVLNRSTVRTVSDLLPLRGADGWTATPWACRLILTDPDQAAVTDVLNQLSRDELEQVEMAIRRESYAELPTYKANCRLVEQALERWARTDCLAQATYAAHVLGASPNIVIHPHENLTGWQQLEDRTDGTLIPIPPSGEHPSVMSAVQAAAANAHDALVVVEVGDTTHALHVTEINGHTVVFDPYMRLRDLLPDDVVGVRPALSTHDRLAPPMELQRWMSLAPEFYPGIDRAWHLPYDEENNGALVPRQPDETHTATDKPSNPIHGPHRDASAPLPGMWAHRGFGHLLGENSIEAFATAVNFGVNFELDVHLVSGELLVGHSPHVDPATAPRLATVAKLAAGTGVEMWVDVKTSPWVGDRQGRELIEEVARAMAGNDVKFRLSCMAWPMLGHARTVFGPEANLIASVTPVTVNRLWSGNLPGVPRFGFSGLLSAIPGAQSLAPNIPELAKAAGANALTAHYSVAGQTMIDRAKAAGMPLVVWTVDDPRLMRHFVSAGVDSIITNRPDRLSRVLKDARGEAQ